MVDFFTGKKISLLGGANIIGVHLAQALLKSGAQVKIFDDLSAGKTENFKHLSDVIFSRMDLRHFENAKRAVHDADIVFHLAAQHGGRGYVATHDVELYNNLELDTTIFRACAEEKVGKVVFSSSACVYPVTLQTNSDDVVRLSEDLVDYNNLQQPDGAYGTEKLIGEQMLDAYIKHGAFKGCSTRSFTVYGPLMNESHAIAALIAKFAIRQDPLEIWGDGEQIRNWTYVEDNVAGAMLAAEHIDRGAINIGIEQRLTPFRAHSEIGDIMGWYPDVVQLRPDKPVGPRNRVADATKLKALGWEPKYTFAEGLKKTIDWYLSTHDVNEVRENLEKRLTER